MIVYLIVMKTDLLTATAEAAAWDYSPHTDQREFEAVRETHSHRHV